MSLFLLKKILTPFMLLPGLFITFFLLSGLWGLYRGRLERSLLNLLIGMILWVLSIQPVADLAHRGLEAGLTIPANPSGDVIIVMGGGVIEKSPDLSGVGIPSDSTWSRIVTAARLQRRLDVPIILSGGPVHSERSPMGPVYRRILIDLGVPEKQVLMEGQSRDTYENAERSAELCRAKGFKIPIVITSAAHMKRTLLSFEKAGMRVQPFPTGFRTWEGQSYAWPDYLPDGYESLSGALHEYIGMVFYRYAY
ncbi:MAG: YdcF family protein [Desulfobacterales bacterium]